MFIGHKPQKTKRTTKIAFSVLLQQILRWRISYNPYSVFDWHYLNLKSLVNNFINRMKVNDITLC